MGDDDTPGEMRMNDTWISVTAHGEGSVAPDMAVVTFAVSANGKELVPLRSDVNTRSSAVLAAVRGFGIADTDIDAPDITIQPEYDYRRGQRLVGYRVVRNMTVRVRELERLGDVLDGIVGAGANEVQGAQMTASDPSAADHAALDAAVRAGRAKAEVLARSAGLKLGAIARIEEADAWTGPPQPMFRMAAAESADVPTEVAVAELKVTRQIRAWFRID